jgi:serine/threonine-protein kinase
VPIAPPGWTADSFVAADSKAFTADGGLAPPTEDLWAAIQAVIEAGLVPIVLYAPSDTAPAGYLISQSPPPGTLVTPGTLSAKVFLLVSLGFNPPGTCTVPNLAGLAAYDAGTALLQAGLSTGYTSWTVSSIVPEGRVVSQSIAAGTTVSPGAMVTYTLSAGPARPPNLVAVPNVSP